MGVNEFRKKDLYAFIFILAVGVFFTATLRDGHNPGGDFAQYILHAKNLAAGIPYADTGYMYNPNFPGLGPKAYPPVLPWMLVPIVKGFGLNLKPMKILLLVFYVLSLTLFYFLIRRHLPLPEVLIALGTVGLNPFFWNFKDDVVSDIPFLCFVFMVFRLADLAPQPDTRGDKRRTIGFALAGGVACYLAYGTRTIGIALPAALVLRDWVRARRIGLFTAVSCALFAILAVVQHLLLPGGNSYFDQFRSLTLHGVARNVMLYADSMIKFWDNGLAGFAAFRYGLFLGLAGLAAVGFLRRLQKPGVEELFSAPYLPIVLLWPTPQGARFMIPILFLFVFWAFLGLNRIRHTVMRRAVRMALIFAIGFTYAGKYRTLDFGPIPTGIGDPGQAACFRYIRSQTPKNAVFICYEPRILALVAERKASCYHEAPSDSLLWSYFEQIRATHLVLGPDDSSTIREFVRRHPSRFERLYDWDRFAIFQIL